MVQQGALEANVGSCSGWIISPMETLFFFGGKESNVFWALRIIMTSLIRTCFCWLTRTFRVHRIMRKIIHEQCLLLAHKLEKIDHVVTIVVAFLAWTAWRGSASRTRGAFGFEGAQRTKDKQIYIWWIGIPKPSPQQSPKNYWHGNVRIIMSSCFLFKRAWM